MGDVPVGKSTRVADVERIGTGVVAGNGAERSVVDGPAPCIVSEHAEALAVTILNGDLHRIIARIRVRIAQRQGADPGQWAPLDDVLGGHTRAAGARIHCPKASNRTPI